MAGRPCRVIGVSARRPVWCRRNPRSERLGCQTLPAFTVRDAWVGAYDPERAGGPCVVAVITSAAICSKAVSKAGS